MIHTVLILFSGSNQTNLLTQASLRYALYFNLSDFRICWFDCRRYCCFSCKIHITHSLTLQFQIEKDTVERISYVKSKLLITSAIASDAGHYRCVASNVWSSDTIDTSLMLMSKYNVILLCESRQLWFFRNL